MCLYEWYDDLIVQYTIVRAGGGSGTASGNEKWR